MYSRILLPIDLDHQEGLEKAISTALDLAEHYSSEVVFAGVMSREPGHLTDRQDRLDELLKEFAQAKTKGRSIRTSTQSVMVIDAAVETHDALLEAVEESGCDLVVMATRIPGVLEHIFASHGGYIASHAKVSVMLVR